MSRNPYLRRFGVEIECGIAGGMEAAARLLGFTTNQYGSYLPNDGWKIGADGSGVELRTPPLRGKTGIKEVRRTMERLKDMGAYVTERDGMHIHHDAPEIVKDPTLAVKLARSWLNNLDEIHKLVHPYRVNSGHCPRWTDEFLRNLEAWASGSTELRTRRHDLNLYSLRKHGTVEIRLHEGTLDPDVMEAWVRFGQKLIHEVVSRPRVMQKTRKRNMIERIRLAPEAAAVLAEKEEWGHRTPGSAYRPVY
jgi:putative amidoligase enzyme